MKFRAVIMFAALAASAMAQSATTQSSGTASAQTGAGVQTGVAGQTSGSGAGASTQTGVSGQAGASTGSGQAGVQGQQQGSATGNVAGTANTAATPAAGAASSGLAANTAIQAVLSKSLDSKKAKPGDAVEARVEQDVKAAGKTIIPRGSKLLGQVTQAQAKANGDAESSLGIAFDRVRLKNGQEMAVNTVIAAMAAPRRDPNMEVDPIAANTGGMQGGGYESAAAGPTGGVAGIAGGAGATVGGAVDRTGQRGVITPPDSGINLGGATGTLGAAANSATGAVIGLKDLKLQSTSTAQAAGSVVTSSGKNVKLEGGTQLLLRAVARQQ